MVKTSDKFRENAENCLQLAEGATNAQAALRYKRMAQAWSALATEQDWLDGYPGQSDRAGELAATRSMVCAIKMLAPLTSRLVRADS
ncbi:MULTISPECIES: hypothetical protein [unclassified Bradyrhizobium]|jgi:hypothetical protein|uniref:hypothetical protein n=1 Tax=unclassified Bradyrhizobium TaxID=2631580 RepID=UPI001FFA793A|nr:MULTISPECIES: hypothetical protein [unclassified Bradyrhizobium]MCK1552638.1 hypothetical protein [Bradyrhizobium sp. 177]MCK1576997.1 hypothetical protein [Bradyrhizobium sp. 174]